MQINVVEYFEKGALLTSREKTAVREPGRDFSFSELEKFAKSCAAAIIKRTDSLRRPIPVFLPKGAANVIADLAILYSGNCYANLDVKSPQQRLKGMLQNLDAALIVTSSALVATLTAIDIPKEKLLVIEDILAGPTEYDNAALLKRLDAIIDTDPYCIIHTSGSTGIPKGVALNHRNTIDFVDWAFERLGLNGTEVMGSLAPIYFDAYTLEFCLCLARGSTWVVVPEQLAMFPAKLVEFVQNQPVNFIFWVPTIMVNVANLDLLAKFNLQKISKVFFIGEVFPTRHLNYWRRHLPKATFVNLYGPIEITVACTYFVVEREFSDEEKLPVGFPCRNTEILILNEQNQLTTTNEPGEICVRGSSLALGYYNNHERTAKGFVQNPLNPHHPELIYRTGDLGYWNERGEVMFLGRRDFQIKHLGYRIELGEIEHAAVQVDGIRNCCVVYDQGKKEITMFYESDEQLAPGFIRERLSPLLPKYMLPTVFNWMELMPRNPNGKIDRQKLVSTVN